MITITTSTAARIRSPQITFMSQLSLQHGAHFTVRESIPILSSPSHLALLSEATNSYICAGDAVFISASHGVSSFIGRVVSVLPLNTHIYVPSQNLPIPSFLRHKIQVMKDISSSTFISQRTTNTG